MSTNVTAGAAFSYQITASNSPTSFAASGTAIPPLAINSGSGVISGNAPTIPGAYPINISAINSAGTNSAILNLTVDPAAGTPVFSSATLNGTVGQAVTDLDLATLVTSNGPVTASSFGFQSALPAGLTQTNGLVSGTPTSAGTNSYIFYASNAAGFGTGTLTIAVQPALPFISAVIPNGQVGTAVDFSFTASNSPTGFGASGLPYGLSISSNRITGTPTASGVYAVSLTATNANGSFTNTFNWTVAAYSTNLPTGTSLLAGWDFQTTNTGGTAVVAATNTPTVFAANFGAGTLYLNGAEGSSAWATNELDATTGTGSVNRANGFSSTTPTGALQILRSTANNKNLVFKVNMASRSDLRISYAINGTSSGFTTQVWEASTNGATWTKFAEVNPVPVPSSSTTYSNQALVSVTGVDGQSNVWIRMRVAGATSTGNNKLDNIQFTAVGPSINISANALSGLSTLLGSASLTASYTVTTANMGSASVVATSQNPSVEVSTNAAGPFGSSATLPSTGGTVHVRLAASAPAGPITGAVIRHTGDVATPADLTVSGNIYARGSSNTLVGWDAEDLTNATVPANWSPTVSNAGITVVSGWSRETNGTLGGILPGSGWGGTSWATNLTSSDAIAANRGATFTIQPQAGKKVSLSSIAKLDYRRSGSGPSNGLVRIQVGTNPWVEVAAVSYSNSTSAGDTLSPINLATNSAFAGISSVNQIKIQLVNFGATGAGGNWYLFDTANTPELDFELTGMVEDDNVPRLVSFSPATGAVGTVVTITGGNFTTNTTVSFNGTAAPILSRALPTQIVASVPNGATSGTVAVVDSSTGLSSTSSVSFVVDNLPQFTSFSPGSATAGSSITIVGSNFTTNTTVSFNGIPAVVTARSTTNLVVTVPAGATTGPITLDGGPPSSSVIHSMAFLVGDFTAALTGGNDFGTVAVGENSIKDLIANGGGLPGLSLVVSVDSPEFEVAAANIDAGYTSAFGASASILAPGGAVDYYNADYFVFRFAPTSSGSKTATATLSSGGMTVGRLALTGNAAGLAQPRFVYGSGQNGQAVLAWTSTISFNDLVLLGREGSPATGSPGASEAFSGVSANFPAASVTSNGASVLFTGDSSTTNLTITGLTNNRFYHFRLFNRQGGFVSSGAYLRVMPYASISSNVLARWDFNSQSLTPSAGTGTAGLVGGVPLSFVSGGWTDPEPTNNRALSVKGSNGVFPGVAFAVNTTGKQGLKVYWDLNASDSASRYTLFQYTTNLSASNPVWVNYSPGTNDSPGVSPEGGLYPVDRGSEWFIQRSADLSSQPGVNNNPNFGFRIITTNAPGTNRIVRADGTTNSYSTVGTIKYDMVTVTGVDGNFNTAPTDLTLTPASIAENNAVNAVIGALSSTDPDAGDTATYSLVSGSGDTDNGSFNISGNSLRASAGLDFETKSGYSIRVRATDSANNTFEKVLTITVTDVDEVAPVITLLGSNAVTISWGGSWTDDGATATDNVDSSVTVNSSGMVNSAVPGTYTITYTASDAAGNAATPVIRTVTVSAPSNTLGADGLSGLLRYAFGANGPNDSVTRPSNSVSGGNLVLTAIVRTNNSKLSVVGEAVTNLSDYTNAPSITPVNGATNGVSQADVPAGCERQAFSVPQGADAKKFLRLKATLAP